MTEKELLLTMKELSRYEVIKDLINGLINGTQASIQLHLSIRQVKNIKAKVIKDGIKAIIHKNKGRKGNRRISEDKLNKIKKIIKEKYSDFKPKFASEKLEECHNITIGREKLRQLMIEWKLWKPKSRKINNQHRQWRERKHYYGEMIQFDGSYHKWFEERNKPCCLLASIDDATSKITKLQFIHWEGVKPAFLFWKEYLRSFGKPCKIYLDKHSSYKQNQKSVLNNLNHLSQFQRAIEQNLDIKIIYANSPQAKGRVERLFGTLQDRLIKELRLSNISDIKKANEFVEKVFIKKFNQKFAVIPVKKGNIHKPLTRTEKQNLDRIFSIQKIKTVHNDFTVNYNKRWFQLLKFQPSLIYQKSKVLIEERTNGQIFISLRNRYLSFKELPARPVKSCVIKTIASTKNKSPWKPSIDHPWKKSFIFPRKTRRKIRKSKVE